MTLRAIINIQAWAASAFTGSVRSGSRRALCGLRRCSTSNNSLWTAASWAARRFTPSPNFAKLEHLVQILGALPLCLRLSEVRDGG